MLENASWISPAFDPADCAVSFIKRFTAAPGAKAKLSVTCIGVYEAYLNGSRVGDFILAPGCTEYEKRLQVQTYDISDMLKESNELVITAGKGWHRSRLMHKRPGIMNKLCAVIAEIDIGQEKIVTDESWLSAPSDVIFNDIWDGETCDAASEKPACAGVKAVDLPRDILIPQEGAYVKEQQVLVPKKVFTAPNGERVVDFGQEITGYVEIRLTARKGERVSLSCGEMLDADGNFYNANYRKAGSRMTYILSEGEQCRKPRFTFYGFRYIRLDEWPGEADCDNFRAIVLHSDMERTGYIQTSHTKLNRLASNALWSLRSNFLDIPTDCPQRDERMGWTGDAQVFAKTACYFYNTKQFFEKWMGELRADQRADGSIPDTVPNFWDIKRSSAAWGDVMTVLPWQVYLMFGSKVTLENNFDAMKAWVDYITGDTLEPDLWIGPDDSAVMWQKHYGDWLALDAAEGSYHGATPNDLVASAFYAYSAGILVKAGRALGKDMTAYEGLCARIRSAFIKRFTLDTQTAKVLALAFDLTDDKPRVAAELVKMLKENGNRLKTGFVGTPYLLYALSENGYADVAYDLLLQEEYPSWLYEVNHGATTIWEHWDGMKDDGSFWSTDMNSFNHYAYGAVLDWVFSAAGGIRTDDEHPGFERVIIAPVPSPRIGDLRVEYKSVKGSVISAWSCEGGSVRYEIDTPVPATVIIDGKTHEVSAGKYLFYSEIR